MSPVIPDDFDPPLELAAPGFRLEPLGPQHNESDHAAWMSSVEHIRSTPGFPWGSWPPLAGLTLTENLRDLEDHAADFGRRTGFTYTVLDDDARVVGCVYIYPSKSEPGIVLVRSWVTADRAELDLPLRDAVAAWLAADWPFGEVRYRTSH